MLSTELSVCYLLKGMLSTEDETGELSTKMGHVCYLHKMCYVAYRPTEDGTVVLYIMKLRWVCYLQDKGQVC